MARFTASEDGSVNDNYASVPEPPPESASGSPGARGTWQSAAASPSVYATARKRGIKRFFGPAATLKDRPLMTTALILTVPVAVVLLAVTAVLLVMLPTITKHPPPNSQPSPTGTTPSLNFDSMRDFVTGYYNDLPARPQEAWAKLDTHCKEQTGYSDFQNFWATISSVTLVSINPRDITSVVARLKYVRRDGTSDTEDRWLKMALVSGAVLLDESGRVGPVAATSSVAAPTNAAPATTQVVTAVAVVNGQPANGYREAPPLGNVNDVFGCMASPAAVANGIYRCAPSAADADVCWPSTPGTLLCVDNPWDHRLFRANYTESLPGVQSSTTPVPFALLLDDGTRCRLRNGGAWGSRDDGLYGAYFCYGDDRVVLEGPNTPAPDRSQPLWTAKIGPLGGSNNHFPPPETHTVTTAWFAGN